MPKKLKNREGERKIEWEIKRKGKEFKIPMNTKFK